MQITVSVAFRDTASSSFEVSSIAEYSLQERKVRRRVECSDLRTGNIEACTDISSCGM